MSLSVSTETKDGSVVVHVGGDLDVYTAPQLQEALDQAFATGGRLVLDLLDVHFIDSTALGVLVGAHQRSQSENGELRLVVEDPLVLKIFHITGFDGVFSIFPRLADALSAD